MERIRLWAWAVAACEPAAERRAPSANRMPRSSKPPTLAWATVWIHFPRTHAGVRLAHALDARRVARGVLVVAVLDPGWRASGRWRDRCFRGIEQRLGTAVPG